MNKVVAPWDAPKFYSLEDLRDVVNKAGFVDNIIGNMWPLPKNLSDNIRVKLGELRAELLLRFAGPEWKTIPHERLDTILRVAIKNYGSAANNQLLPILFRLLSPDTENADGTSKARLRATDRVGKIM